MLTAASRPIRKGDVLCRLPLGLTLSPDSPLRNPLTTIAISGPDAPAPSGLAPLTPMEVEAGSELRGMIDRIPASLWPLKGGLRLLFEFALESGSRNTPGLPGAETRGSFYAPYLHLLPNKFDTIPLFWSAPQVAALQYEPLAAQLRLRSSFLRNKSAELSTHVHVFGKQAADLTTPERLAWAMSCVSSRAFQLRPDAAHCTNLPLIDMMNHSYDNNCKVEFAAGADGRAAVPPPADADLATQLAYYEQPIQVVATRDIAPQTELSLNYGWHSNEHFLLNYGFMLDENPADVLETRRDPDALEVAADMAGEKVDAWESAPAWKRSIAMQQGLSSVSSGGLGAMSDSAVSTPFRITRDLIDPQLIAIVQVMLADKDATPVEHRRFEHFLAQSATPTRAVAAAAAEGASSLSAQSWTPSQQDLSTLSMPVVHVLYSYISLLQSSFPTTLQQDVEALGNVVQTIMTPGADPSLEEAVQREEIAVRFRIGKKRILAEHMRKLQNIIGGAGKQ